MNLFIKKCYFRAILSMYLPIMLINISGESIMAQQVNFSGTWNLNQEKTDFGDHFSPNSIAIQLTVIQQKDTINIARVSRNHLGETHSYVEKLPLNGKTSEISVNAAIKKITAIKWSEDGQVLTEASTYIVGDSGKEQRKGHETWALSNGARTLTISRVDEDSNGSFPTKAVYDK